MVTEDLLQGMTIEEVGSLRKFQSDLICVNC
jgi:hypothetical protein